MQTRHTGEEINTDQTCIIPLCQYTRTTIIFTTLHYQNFVTAHSPKAKTELVTEKNKNKNMSFCLDYVYLGLTTGHNISDKKFNSTCIATWTCRILYITYYHFNFSSPKLQYHITHYMASSGQWTKSLLWVYSNPN